MPAPRGAAEPDDQEVGRRFAAGDEQALAWAYERWAGQIHGMAVRAFGPGPGRRGRHPADLRLGLDRPRRLPPGQGPAARPGWSASAGTRSPTPGPGATGSAGRPRRRCRRRRRRPAGRVTRGGRHRRRRPGAAARRAGPPRASRSAGIIELAFFEDLTHAQIAARTGHPARHGQVPHPAHARTPADHGWRWTVQHCTPEQLALAALREPLPADDAAHLAGVRAVPGRGRVPAAGGRRARRPAVRRPRRPRSRRRRAVWDGDRRRHRRLRAPRRPDDAGAGRRRRRQPAARRRAAVPLPPRRPGSCWSRPRAAWPARCVGAGAVARAARTGTTASAVAAVALDPLADNDASGRAEVVVRDDGTRVRGGRPRRARARTTATTRSG